MIQRDMHIQGPQINQFNNIAPNPVPRSAFQRDFTRRTTFDADYLVPIFVDEILPGDEVNLNLTAQIRMTTPQKPLMDNLYLETFFFFIPNRLTWDKWENFQGQQITKDPVGLTAYTIPVLDKTKAPMSTTGFLNESLYDYLGLPTLVTGLSNVSALFARGYKLCYTEWFRDENLMNPLPVATGDGPDDPALYTLLKRLKRKDYQTSCLPWPQKGNPITVAIGTTAPVKGIGIQNSINMGSVTGVWETGAVSSKSYTYGRDALNGGIIVEGTGSVIGTGGATPAIYADLTSASAITINALRQAALYQQILELDARGGTRYVESIYSRFGVISPDFRLQRPELIGQGHSRINIYAVPQTAPSSDTTTPQGNLAAFSATPITSGHGCRYAATEHGIIIGMMNVRADLTYQQALPKMFTRQTRLEFYEPLLNGLGEQAVLNHEVVADGTSNDQVVFGYQERWAEMRFKNSEVTGKFRSNDPQSLDVWHLSQEFGSPPSLNETFITENVPMDRVLAVSDEPNFLGDLFFSYRHVRPMPIRSNPGIDRL